MKNLQTFLTRMKSCLFPSKDDRAWKEWVDFKKRETRDLIDLLSANVRESLKQRALYLLLVPSEDFNVLYWTEDVGKFYRRTGFLKNLSASQLEYVTNRIMEFHSMIMPQHCPYPQHTASGGGGLTIFMSTPDKYHNALSFYNLCIVDLMHLLPAEKAEKLFPFFSLRDISTYSNMEDASGYGPFRNLLYHPEIDKRWKKEADVKMRLIIKDEIAGRISPREEWEGALRQYADIVTTMLFGDKLPYAQDMWIAQLQFIMDNRQGTNAFIRGHMTDRLFAALPGDEHKNLRHELARYSVLEDADFSIYDASSRQVAGQMLAEFADDNDLVVKINELIAESDQRLSERKAEEAAQKAAEDSVLAQME